MEGAYAYGYWHTHLARTDLLTGQVLGYATDGLGSARLVVDAATQQIVDS